MSLTHGISDIEKKENLYDKASCLSGISGMKNLNALLSALNKIIVEFNGPSCLANRKEVYSQCICIKAHFHQAGYLPLLSFQ
jgi:hypothetical protein